MPQLQFELVAPEKLMLGKAVTMVTVPGAEGDYGVLAGHAPLITTVRPGVIEVYGENETTVSDRIFVAGGFAEVTAERCTVLAEEAVPVSQLDRAQLEENAKSLAENAAAAKPGAERARIEEQLAVTQAKLAALGN